MHTKPTLARSTPEDQGISSSSILQFLQSIEENIQSFHSFMLLRHGFVVTEGWWHPYKREYPHMLFSLSKSFTSTAIGQALSEGLLSLDDFVVDFFAKELPKQISTNLKAMRVRHLLSMSTGHAEDTTPFMVRRKDKNWVRGFLTRPVKYEPGTHFLYNTGATYMLSAILQKLTGVTLLEYLRPRLFDPLGIQNPTWETCPRGINTGGFGLTITTEDIARFGQLYLQKGMWNGSQLLPESWVEQASRKQVSNGVNPDSDWEQGYGYQFWRCRYNIYRGDGAFGQYCIVMPEQDAVLAITSGVPDMQIVLNLVWEHLLPAFKPASLASDPSTQRILTDKLNDLCLPPMHGSRFSSKTASISGKRFLFEPNKEEFRWVSFDFSGDENTITFKKGRSVHQLKCGMYSWLEGTTSFQNGLTNRVAVSSAWTEPDSLSVKSAFTETPFITDMTFTFKDDLLLYGFSVNVNFEPTDPLRLVAHLEG